MNHARILAAAQTVPIAGRVEENLERHLRLVRLAAEARAQVLVFPELSLTGYEMERADALAFSRTDPRLGPLVEAAASSSMVLIVGAPVRLGSRLHIGAFILSPDGAIGLYTKQRLGAFPSCAGVDGVVPPAEACVFHPGDENPLIPFGGNLAAVAVCADTGRASHPREAAERGAGTYLASMFVIPSDFPKESASLRAYAVEHSLTVVFANFGGPSGGLASAGRSAIWSSMGEVLAQLGPAGAGVVVASEEGEGWIAKAIALDQA